MRWYDIIRLTLASLAFACFPVKAASVNTVAKMDADFIEWLDQAFLTAEQEKRFSAAVINVEQGGQVLLQRTYGAPYAHDRDRDPETAQYRIGSITKVFVGLAIAQLVDRGDIQSINDAANTYLSRFQLPDNRGQDVTLRHLLTHTAGVEERASYFADYGYSPDLSGEDLRMAWPSYFRAAGEGVSYCNICVTILGVVIEDISGRRLSDYLEAEIFAPLNMYDTYLDYDFAPPHRLAEPASWTAAETQVPLVADGITPLFAAAGSMISTRADMQKFARALLNGTKGHDGPLASTTVQRAFQLLERNSEALPGIGYLFWVDDRYTAGRIIEHSGSWKGFTSLLLIFPDQDASIFFSIAGDRTQMAQTNVHRYLQSAVVSQAIKAYLFGTPDEFALRSYDQAAAKKYVGRYVDDRRSHKTTEKAGLLLAGAAAQLAITAQSDGLYLNKQGPFLPIGEGRFTRITGEVSGRFGDAPQFQVLHFYTNAKGRVVGGTYSTISTAQKEGVLMNATLMSALFPFCVFGGFMAIFAWVWRGRGAAIRCGRYAAFTYAAGVFALLANAFLPFGVDGLTPLAANLAALAAVVLAITTGYAWRGDHGAGWGTRGFMTLTAVFALMVLPVFAYGNLLGFNSP